MNDEKHEAFMELHGRMPNGVTVRSMMNNYPKLFTSLTTTREYIERLRDKDSAIQVKKRSGVYHFFIAPNLYSMLHFELLKETRAWD